MAPIRCHAGDVNLIGGDIRTIERIEDVLLNACNYIGFPINTRKTKYMEIGRHQGLIANEHIRISINCHKNGKLFNN